jgi:hypothetical protein
VAKSILGNILLKTELKVSIQNSSGPLLRGSSVGGGDAGCNQLPASPKFFAGKIIVIKELILNQPSPS